jgi:hypothetical protein
MTQHQTITCSACGARGSGKFCNQCGASLAAGICRSCTAALAPGARFCNECGTPAGAKAEPVAASPSSGSSAWIPWTIAGALLIGIVSYFLAQNATTEDTPVVTDGSSSMAPFAGGAGGGGGALPDIASMSPRERAGRLYDRIMRYAEEGKRDSLQVFAPMAMGAYEALGDELDLDARYDYGRVAMETGSLEIAIAQADTILKVAPSHLLGLALAARSASLQGNPKGANGFWARFEAAKTAELAKNLPEYEAHRGDIERAAELAKARP